MKPADLRKMRVRLGHSQATLATELGLSRETVNRYERAALPIPRWLQHALAGLKPRRSR